MNRTLFVSIVLAAAMGCHRDPPPPVTVTTTAQVGQPGSPMAAQPGMAGHPMVVAPGMMPGMAQPAMMAAGAGGGSCAAFQSCCTALSAMPNMAAMAGSCAQAPQLAALGAQGEQACSAALSGLRQAAAAMGNTPAACAGGGAAPAAAGMMAPGAAAPAVGAAPAGQAGMVGVGQTVQGMLQQGDTVLQDEGGRLADDYTISLTAGSPITIVTRGGPSSQNAGQTLDVVTAVICNGQQVARDDDGAGYPNSRIVYTPTASGTCTVRVMGFAGDAGQYTLQTYAGSLDNQT